MIKAENETVEVHGDLITLLDEFSNIIADVRIILAEDFGAETADKVIAHIGQAAFLFGDDSEEAKEKRNKIYEKVTELLISGSIGIQRG